MNKTIHSYIGASLIAISSASYGENNPDTATATIEENIAHTVQDICNGKQGAAYLNCQLKKPRDGTHTTDGALHKKIDENRKGLNLFLKNSLSLPVEIRKKGTGSNSIEGYTSPSFMPEGFITKIRRDGKISVTYELLF